MDSEQFKAWRKRLGLSQNDACDLLDISRGTLQSYERGTRLDDGMPSPIPVVVRYACWALECGLQQITLEDGSIKYALGASTPSDLKKMMKENEELRTARLRERMKKSGDL